MTTLRVDDAFPDPDLPQFRQATSLFLRGGDPGPRYNP